MGSIPMLNIGPQELLLVLIIGLIVVGPKRLPELSRQIGRGLREFRKLQDDVKGLVNLDEVTNEFKGMIRFDGDDAEPASASNGSTRRPPTTATAPSVHRSSRTNGSAADPAPTSPPDDASPQTD
jgi:sec-independent protein translocase protein TatB